MRIKPNFFLNLFLLIVVFTVAAGPAQCAIEASRISSLGGGIVRAMRPFNGGLWLGVANGAHGEVWTSDGTAAGTVPIENLPTMPHEWSMVDFMDFVEVGNSLLFKYMETDFEDTWYAAYVGLSNGTAAGTAILTEGWYNYVGTLGNVVFFSTHDFHPPYPGSNYKLWRSNGTVSGTYVLKQDVGGGQGVAIDNVLYFPWNGLWRTDGTASGTYAVQPSGGTCSGSLVEKDGILYFRGSAGTEPASLFRSDGTTGGTYTLQPAGGTCDGDFFVAGNAVCFRGTTSGGTSGLLGSDGTVSGTILLSEISPYGDTRDPVVLGDTVIFMMSSTTTDSMWATDGTPHGTRCLLSDYQGGVPPAWPVVFGGTVYFLADAAGGKGLWKTDGSVAHTSLVSANDFGLFAELAAVDEQLMFWFQTDDYDLNEVLYASDGTEPGTRLVDTAEVSAAGAGLEGLYKRGAFESCWSQNGVVNLSCWYTLQLLGRVEGSLVRMVQLHDSALGLTDNAGALRDAHPVVLDGTIYFTGYEGGIWATSTSFRFTRMPHVGKREVGDPLDLSFGYEGDAGPLSFQWFKDTNIVDGATSADFHIDSLVEDDEGWYRCQVTDTAKAVHETDPVFVEVFPAGTLPAAGTLGLIGLAGACIAGAARVLRRRQV